MRWLFYFISFMLSSIANNIIGELLGFRLGPLLLCPIAMLIGEGFLRLRDSRKEKRMKNSEDYRYEQIKKIVDDEILKCCHSYRNDPAAMETFLNKCVTRKAVSVASKEIIMEHYFGKSLNYSQQNVCSSYDSPNQS